MGCNFLPKKKIEIWYNENCSKTEKEFAFRFRGKKAFAFLKHFVNLIYNDLTQVSNGQVKYR